MQRKPAVGAFFVLLLGSSLFLLFSEQRMPVGQILAVLKQPGTIGLVNAAASQDFFVKNISFVYDFLLLASLIILALSLKRIIKPAGDMLPVAAPINTLAENRFVMKSDAQTESVNSHSLNNDHDSLKAQVEKLEEDLRKKDDFIAIASHELKTPLSSLKVYVQLLELITKSQGQTQYSEYLEKITSQVDKLTHLISTLLDIARIEGGKITYAKEPIDLEDLIKTVIAEMQMHGNHSIYFEGKLLYPAYGDKERITQVIQNLISNAIKYSPGKTSVELKLFNMANKAIVSVSDHGIGIDQIFHKKIFDRFFRINRDIQGAYTGLGVGLFISCQIIEHHGGTMWVESTIGKGSTFYFSLPLAKDFL